MSDDPIFQPIEFPNLTVKNRIFRSSISGKFDNYDGSGTQARLNWEEKFARGGAGAIISSFVPINVRGRIQPNYAMIDDDDKIPFWRAVGETCHKYDCKFIMQLSHSGRQQDVPGLENHSHFGMSSTSEKDTFHGLLCKAMTKEQIKMVVQQYVDGARRAREAGLDGVELHASHGYLITQFLSSGINDRTDEYGGSIENRYRFLGEIITGIRKEVGNDFHLQAKINAVDHGNALYPWEKPGDDLETTINFFQWAERDGCDALHVSIGSLFPHPLLPSGALPLDEAGWWYGSMGSSGVRGYWPNYTFFHFRALRPLFLALWNRTKKNHPLEGVSMDASKWIKERVNVPVINTGGFQRASVIRRAISEDFCDAVAIARPFIANNDLAKILETGAEEPDNPCSFCNRCLVNVMFNPLACYDLRRFDGDDDAMIKEAMTVFHPPHFN